MFQCQCFNPSNKAKTDNIQINTLDFLMLEDKKEKNHCKIDGTYFCTNIAQIIYLHQNTSFIMSVRSVLRIVYRAVCGFHM